MKSAPPDRWVPRYKELRRAARMSGPRGMGRLYDSAAAALDLPEEWQAFSGKSLATYERHRARYPQSKYQKQNDVFDLIASYSATLDEVYKSATARNAQVKKLMAEIDGANDPAAKADLANRLINEQNAIQSSRQTLAVLEARHREELETAQAEARREFMCKEFKREGC
ncbi:MAG: hypothetical protein LBI87_09055 [Candidatus Accumulibacter sp.]|jgi:type IV secretion system protein VirB5|nr:hypothetical protein [Accumulibacter sp.]